MENDKYIGKLLDGRYEILEVIGNGGMAVVYKARCHRLNRMVAIKILKDEFSQDEDFRRRFHAESQAVAMLSHPNIVSVYDVSSSQDSDYIVMELIDGITLKYYMEKKGVLNWKETLHFAMQIAKALEHAHSRGIVHRDIKPHNVMVLKNGSVKVADFGIAQIMSTSNTMTQEALGSVHYISPEQAKGSRVDSRSDVYSLGIVMYEMIAGRVPYDGDTPVSVVMKHINGGAQLPTTLNPNTPRGLEQIIMKAMSQQPKDRYATATAMLYDMDEFRKDPVMVFPEQKPVEKDVTQPIHVVSEEKNDQTIAQRKVQPEKKADNRSRTTTIAIASCAVVGLVAVIILLLLLPSCQRDGGQVTVPNLIGQYYDSLPHYDGIEVIKQGDGEPSTEYAAGQILYQSHDPGDKVSEGTKIFVIISRGSQQMPDVTDKTVDEAEQILGDLDISLLVTLVKENSSEVEKDHVIRTEPAVGEALRTGQEVKVFYSIGAQVHTAIVPDVRGENIEEAKKSLNDAGFSNFKIEPIDSQLPKDAVVNLSLKPGTVLDFNKKNEIDVTQEITIYVSKGVQMEDLSGMLVEAAVEYLDDLDMDLVIVLRAEASDEVAVGEVVRTEPAAEEFLTPGDEVVVYYSGVTVIPDVRGQKLAAAKTALAEAGFQNTREKETSSCLPKGTVVKLSEDAGVQADVSKQIVIYVSKGDQGLKDLAGMSVTEAKHYIDSLDLSLKIREKPTEDSTIKADAVVRTEPAAGSTVNFGQEIVIYCSTGPAKAVVPDVEGYSLSDAQNALNDAGFYALEIQEIDGDGPAGHVLALSVTVGQRIDVTTPIIIYVARQSAAQETTISKLFVLPEHSGLVLVTITCDGETIFEQEADATVQTVQLTLTGSGTKEYKIFINGQHASTETVEFDPDE